MTQSTRPDPTDEAIVIECELEQSPELVWQALTDPDLVVEWLGPISRGSEMDRSFTVHLKPAEGGPVTCRVLEAVPHERLSYSWVRSEPSAKTSLDTIVTFELSLTPGNGTHLQVTHGKRDVQMPPSGTIMKAGRVLSQIRPHGRMSGRTFQSRFDKAPRCHPLISTSARRAA